MLFLWYIKYNLGCSKHAEHSPQDYLGIEQTTADKRPLESELRGVDAQNRVVQIVRNWYAVYGLFGYWLLETAIIGVSDN